MVESHPLVLDKFRVNAKDRAYQIWKRNSLGIELYSHDVFIQKLEYIHWNPVKAGLCSLPEEYYYSSAVFIIQAQMILEYLHIAKIYINTTLRSLVNKTNNGVFGIARVLAAKRRIPTKGGELYNLKGDPERKKMHADEL